MIEFDHTLPEAEKRRIVSNALQQVLGGPEVTVANLLGAIGKLQHDFLQQSTKPYVLATTLSVKSNALLPRNIMAKAEASVEELVGMIERGELRLPEMQRQ